MSRKVYVEVVTRVILDLEDGVEVGTVVSELDYEFKSATEGAQVLDTEIRDYTVTDSK